MNDNFSPWPSAWPAHPGTSPKSPSMPPPSAGTSTWTFRPALVFPRPSGGQQAPVYDTAPRSWRHLNFFQYEGYLHAFLPRVDGGEPDGVKTVAVPWARPGSGFTLLLEAMIVMLCQGGLTVAEAARTVSRARPPLVAGAHPSGGAGARADGSVGGAPVDGGRDERAARTRVGDGGLRTGPARPRPSDARALA